MRAFKVVWFRCHQLTLSSQSHIQKEIDSNVTYQYILFYTHAWILEQELFLLGRGNLGRGNLGIGRKRVVDNVIEERDVNPTSSQIRHDQDGHLLHEGGVVLRKADHFQHKLIIMIIRSPTNDVREKYKTQQHKN